MHIDATKRHGVRSDHRWRRFDRRAWTEQCPHTNLLARNIDARSDFNLSTRRIDANANGPRLHVTNEWLQHWLQHGNRAGALACNGLLQRASQNDHGNIRLAQLIHRASEIALLRQLRFALAIKGEQRIFQSASVGGCQEPRSIAAVVDLLCILSK